MAYIGNKRVITVLRPVIEDVVEGESSWCGEYIDGTGYKKGAIVSYNGNVYLCIKDLDDMQDPTNAEYWEMLNEEGEVIPEISEVDDFKIEASGLDTELEVSYSVSEKVALPAGRNLLAYIEDANYTPSNIKKGESIFGLEGEYEGEAPKLQEKTATANGEVTADEGYDGLSKVTVNVSSEAPTLQEKTVTPTKAVQEVKADEGNDGLSKVVVEPIPDEYVIPNLQEKTIAPKEYTQEITADSGNDGLSKVTVEAIPSEYIIPSGSLNITENKTVDVTEYASVTVAVPSDTVAEWDGSGVVIEAIEEEDELAGTWVFNDYPTELIVNQTYNVEFASNGVNFTTLRTEIDTTSFEWETYGIYYNDTQAYYENWRNSAYETITITSKLSEVTNGDTLLEWLKANATKQ